jgi:NAD(P)-dependent dehydrogenase (short-subunit alcohol dehydrogenase family)
MVPARADPPRLALITGANRGIGFEICRQLGRGGLRVVLTARDERKGHQAAARLRTEGLDVHFHRLDVTDAESIGHVGDFVEREFGGADVLVNNAGVYPDEDVPGLSIDLETVRRTMEVNTYGPLLLCQMVIPRMRRRGYGRIVNVSSRAGAMSEMAGGTLAYRVSKVSLNAITRILADEVRGTGILINAMCPGWVRTEMGGRTAPRSVEEGADTAIFLATLPDGGPTGGFFRDRKPVPW